MKVGVENTIIIIDTLGAMSTDYKTIKGATGWLGKLLAGMAILPKVATIAMAAPNVQGELSDLDETETAAIAAAGFNAAKKWADAVQS
jgi:hypothetical protein